MRIVDKKILLNFIKSNGNVYNKYIEHKHKQGFYMPKNEQYPDIEIVKKEIDTYLNENQCIYCICIVYDDNNRVISHNDIKVSEIGIYELYKNNNDFNKKFMYETNNINYIKYILSTYLKAIDNWSTREFYEFASACEFIERFEEFIGIVINDKRTSENSVNENIAEIDYIYKICFSNSYKRLQDKAQVFSSAKGDHYRNRLIHTNEVAVISSMIVDAINNIFDSKKIKKISKDIVIAIALGHDIGHTPFGHQGERTLNDIIKEKKFDIIKNAGEVIFKIKINENSNIENKSFGKLLFKDTGGFKHNVQSVRVLTEIENDDSGQKGLKIDPEILEGILKHTKYEGHEKMLSKEVCDLINFDNYENCIKDSSNIDNNIKFHYVDDYNGRYVEFDPYIRVPYYMLKKFANIYANKYLTGEIVAFADEIAQRCSDIEDAIRSGFVSFNEFGQWLIDMKYENIISKDDLDDIDVKAKMAKLRKNIISYYIDKLSKSILETKDYKHIFFDKELFNLNEIIDGYIKNKLISSNEISKFDNISEIVISSIFRYYYNNPRLLNDNVTKKVFFEMLLIPLLKDNAIYFSEMSKDYTEKVIKNYLNISYYDLVLIKYFTVDEKYVLNYDEIEKIENDNLNSNNKYYKYYMSEFDLGRIDNSIIDKYEINMLKNIFECFKNEGIAITNGYLIKKMISYEQQKIVIRAICDYISGMTDTFALSEYNNLQ